MINIGKARQIDGWMTDPELMWLATKAKDCKIIIEVGSWHGRSTRALGDNIGFSGVVYAVDHWSGSANEKSQHNSANLLDGDHAYLEFLKNNDDLIESGKLIPIRMSSKNASLFLKQKGIKADMIFIDAGHTFEEVTDDINNWWTLVKDDGILCGHDFSDDWKGVQDAVHATFPDYKVMSDGTIWYTIINSKLKINKNDKIITIKDGITVGIPTKNRYESLSHTLLSIAFQTLKPIEVLIVDDSDNPIDLRRIPIYYYIFKLFDEFGIRWEILFGTKKGPHISHQMIQSKARGEFIFRIDDDEVAEPDVLKKLHSLIINSGDSGPGTIGAVAPLVLMPDVQKSTIAKNVITDVNLPNVQWFRHDGSAIEVDHLHSSFLYRKGITDYSNNLSPVGHREETIFTYQIKRQDYELLVDTSAIVRHFRQESGGIRSHNNEQFYKNDEAVFNGFLNLWNIKTDENIKYVILDNGLGDHFAFKNILPELKKKHKRVVIACCYPEVFYGDMVEIISIADAKSIFKDIEVFNIYGFMDKLGWDKSIIDAFKLMYS